MGAPRLPRAPRLGAVGGPSGQWGQPPAPFHTYHELCARASLDRANHATERALPLSPWEAILDNVFEGLPLPHTLETSLRLLLTPHPQAWAAGGHWRGGFTEGRWDRGGWEGSLAGGSQLGRFGVVGWGAGGRGATQAPLTSPCPLSNHTITMPTILLGLNKIPQISFMAAFATSVLSVLDPNTHCNLSLG